MDKTREDITVKFSRVWAMPSAWTFTIKPIKELLSRYVPDGHGWIDPYSGLYSPAQYTNDMLPERNAIFCMDALEFCTTVLHHIKPNGGFEGILFDPPYSYRQVSEHYKEAGRRATSMDTSTNFYNRIKNATADHIKQNGLAISFGWNSVGFGKNRGFELEEILLVCHGGHHNDTIVTVERKR